MPEFKTTLEVINKRAEHEYFFDAQLEAGMVLTGTEIKSIRLGNVNLRDAYCYFRGGELFVKSLYIKEYKYGNHNNHEARRARKLLLKKSELRKLERKVKEKGYTIIPYRLFLSDRGFAKLEIALARGKKSYDKRESIKQKDLKRDLERMRKI
jgi:SsrA-binding protein